MFFLFYFESQPLFPCAAFTSCLALSSCHLLLDVVTCVHTHLSSLGTSDSICKLASRCPFIFFDVHLWFLCMSFFIYFLNFGTFYTCLNKSMLSHFIPLFLCLSFRSPQLHISWHTMEENNNRKVHYCHQENKTSIKRYGESNQESACDVKIPN